MPYITREKSRFYYIDKGQGLPLMFLHGLGGDHHLFDPQIECFSQTHRVIIPHNRGNGLTGVLQGRPEQVLDQQCEDIAELIQYLGLKRVILCGTSYGGVICFHFILHYPELVGGMVIADSFSDTRCNSFTERLIQMFHYFTIWTSYLPGEWMIPLLKWRYRNWPEARNYAVYVARTIRSQELALQRKAIQKIDYTDQLRSVRCPVLGIVGDTLRGSIRAMQRGITAIPGGRLEIVRNSFDPTNLCQPRIYNSLLHDFLKNIGW